MAKYDDPKDRTIRCSFCGRTQDQVSMLIQGPDAFICDSCVASCLEIIENGDNDKLEKTGGKKKPSSSPRILPKPDELKAKLDEYVIGLQPL